MKNVLTITAIGIALLAGLLFAADDDADPIITSTVTESVSQEPSGFTVTMEVTPVTKVGGTNVANVISIKVEKFNIFRTTRNGVQVGDTRRVSLGQRDATAWFMARTNVTTGLPVALNISPDRASWAASAWNNSQPAE